jgi:hypothetical protein
MTTSLYDSFLYLGKSMSEDEILKVAEKISELGISINSDSFILISIIGIFSAAIGAFFGAYFRKKGENKAAEESFKSVLNRLEKTTMITAEIRNSLNAESHVYMYKFEKYYERQVNAIEILHNLLIRVETSSKKFIEGINYSELNLMHFKEAKLSTEELIIHSNLKGIWIPQEIQSKIEQLALLIKEHIYDVYLKAKSTEIKPLFGDVSTPVALEIINKKIPELRKEIIDIIKRELKPAKKNNSKI